MIGKDSHYTHYDLLIKVIYEHAISAIDSTSCTDGQSTQYDRRSLCGPAGLIKCILSTSKGWTDGQPTDQYDKRSLGVPASVSLLHLMDVLMLRFHIYIIHCYTHTDVISDVNGIYFMAAKTDYHQTGKSDYTATFVSPVTRWPYQNSSIVSLFKPNQAILNAYTLINQLIVLTFLLPQHNTIFLSRIDV
jgi:hypothetical protein